MSDGGPWQPPDPNSAVAYPTAPTVELEPTSAGAPTPKRSPAVIIAAVVGVEPTGDIHGSAEYRKRLVGVMARRAILAAAHRAAGGSANGGARGG